MHTRSRRNYGQQGPDDNTHSISLGAQRDDDNMANEALLEQIRAMQQQLHELQMAQQRPNRDTSRENLGGAMQLDRALIKPPKFGATRSENVSDWLFELDNYFKALQFNDEQRLAIIPNYFTTNALRWWKMQEKLVETGEEEEVTSWKDMKKLLSTFEIHDEEQNARRQILKAHQGTRSIRDYNAYFTQLAFHLPRMDMADKVELYMNGLNPAILRDFGGEQPTKLLATMQRAERIEINLTRRGVLHNKGPTDGRFQRNNRPNNFNRPPTQLYALGEAGDAEEPIENKNEELEDEEEVVALYHLNRAKSGRSNGYRNKSEEVSEWLKSLSPQAQQWFRDGKCTKCGGTGHFARHCRMKPPALLALDTDPEDHLMNMESSN